jgi:hypothetical protein
VFYSRPFEAPPLGGVYRRMVITIAGNPEVAVIYITCNKAEKFLLYAYDKPVPFIQVRPPGYFTHFYNHAHRLRLEKILYLELSRSSNGYLNHFWIQVAVSILKRPLRTRFGSETVTNL